MRLTPIEKPASLKVRLAYAFTKRKFGKVITPMKVLYARVPESLQVARAMSTFSEGGISLDPALRHLVLLLVARRNGCGFCIDIGCALWLSNGGSLAKVKAVLDYADNPIFSDAERAALAYADEVNSTRNASDDTFARLKAHFNEREMVEITWLVAQENFYNFLNKPFGIESDGLCMLMAPDTGREAAQLAQ